MFSKRLLKLLELLTSIGRKFGSCIFSFDPNTLVVSNSSDPKVASRLRRTYNFACLWAAASSLLIVKHYRSGDVGKYNITVLQYITGITLLSGYSILRWFSDDLLKLCGGAIVYLKRFQGKKKKHKDRPSFPYIFF